MTDSESLARVVGAGHLGALTTIKRDGRPQLSNVAYFYDHDTGIARVSVTDGRAKTANIRRDNRVSLYVASAEQWTYAVAEGVASLSAVAIEPSDETVEALVGLYRDLRGEHPDWSEYRSVMVAERRVLLSIDVQRFYGNAAG